MPMWQYAIYSALISDKDMVDVILVLLEALAARQHAIDKN